jgi:predicted DNA-binding antitoxin AbrB/MazE fold protein
VPTQKVEAIFERGAFRVIESLPVPLREGQHVRLVIETDESPDAILALAADVYTGLSRKDIDEVEQIALQRYGFFGDKR